MTDIETVLTCFVGIVNYLTKTHESIAQSTMLGFGAIKTHTSRVLFSGSDALVGVDWHWYCE
jgi:hypothetical protein